MGSGHRTRALLALAIIGGVLALLVASGFGALADPTLPGHSASRTPTLASPTGPRPAITSAVAPAGGNWQIVGKYNGQLFNASTTLPSGDTNYALDAVTNANPGIVYAANAFGGTVTSFNLTHGTLFHAVTLANPVAGTTLAGLTLDTVDQKLFVLVNSTTGNGWVDVVGTKYLDLEGNITFGSYPLPGRFVPEYAAYDPSSDQVFVEAGGGGLVVINASNHLWTATLGCPGSIPTCKSLGITEVPALHDLVEPTGTNVTIVYNSSDPTAAPHLMKGPAGAVTAFAAYDSVDGYLYVDNLSAKPGNFLRFYLSNYTYAGSPSGPLAAAPAFVSSLGYDPVSNTLVVVDVRNTTEIWTFDATTGNVTAHAGGTPANGVHVYTAVSVDSAKGWVVATGTGNNTTNAYQLPGLALRLSYSSFPLLEDVIGVDSTAGILAVEGTNPNVLAGISVYSHLPVWTDYLKNVPPVPVNRTSINLATGMIYLSENDTNRTVFEVNIATGSSLGPVFGLGPGPNPIAIAVDGTHQVLYVTTSGHVTEYNSTSGALLGSVPTPAIAGCAIISNDSSELAYFANCNSPGAVESLYGANHTLGPFWAVSADPYSLTLGGENRLFVACALSEALVVINTTNATVAQTISTSPLVPESSAADSAYGLLLVSAWHNATTAVLNLSGATVAPLAPNLPQSSPMVHFAYDPNANVLLGAEATTGETYTLVPVVAPSAPSGLGGVATNGTFAATWKAPASLGNGPITSYTVYLSTSPSATPIQTVTVTALNATFTGLTNGVTYSVMVVATNPAGTGPAAGPVSGTPVAIPYPPTGLARVAVTNDSIEVTWNAPTNTGGLTIQGYFLEWRASSTGSNAFANKTVLAPPYNITGLTANFTYIIQVSASNTVGNGAPSPTITVNTAANPPPPPKPTPPSSSSNSNFLGLSWEEWAGIGAVIAGVVILLAVILLTRRRSPPAATRVSSTGLPPPAPAPPAAAPAPWDEGPDQQE